MFIRSLQGDVLTSVYSNACLKEGLSQVSVHQRCQSSQQAEAGGCFSAQGGIAHLCLHVFVDKNLSLAKEAVDLITSFFPGYSPSFTAIFQKGGFAI